MSGAIEGFILFGDLNTVVFWHINRALDQYLRDKCAVQGIDSNDFSACLTQLFGHLINVEAQYDTKQNNVDLIYCENGFTVKLRHLGVYSLLVLGNSEENSHLLYMADMFRAITQLFVGYSYGSLCSKPEVSHCVSGILHRNSLLSNGAPYQFLRACEVLPAGCRDSNPAIISRLEKLVSSSTAASILDGFGTVLEAHCFVSNLLVGSVRCAPQTTRQRILPSELWKLRDMADVVSKPSVTAETCTTVNVFLNSCESPYFLACRAHVISPVPEVTCVLLTEHDWSSIARPIRRLLKLLSMILRGQPSVLRLTPRHIDTIASTELNRMSDCLDAFGNHDSTKTFPKVSSVKSSSNTSDSLDASSIDSTVFPSGSKMLPSLSGIRSLMQKALNQFRTLRQKNAFHSFCRDPRNTAHHSSVKQLYNIVEQLHTMLFQPLVFSATPEVFARPLVTAGHELMTCIDLGQSIEESLPPVDGDFSANLMLCVLVDRSSNTFACFPSLRADSTSRLSLQDGAVSLVLQDLVQFMQSAMWLCWPLIKAGHCNASWVTDFVDYIDGLKRFTPVRFAYAANVVTVPAALKLAPPSSSSKSAAQSPSFGPGGDFSQFEQVFNDPDVTSQLIWNEHFYRMLARIYAESAPDLSVSTVSGGSNVFAVDFNAAMRSRSVTGYDHSNKGSTVTIVYEAFCLFLEPVASNDVDRVFKHLFSDGVQIFNDSDRFFPLNGIAASRR